MDSLSGSTATIARSTSSGMIEGVIGFVVAVAILRVEVMRHTGNLPGLSQSGYVKRCWQMLQRYAPEIGGLVLCLSVAAYLRFSSYAAPDVSDEAWAAIMREWPLLLTADSLLSLQAMLRVIVLLSAVIRCGTALPFAEEAAAFFCAAAVARVVLFATNASYMLDGPLGGFPPAVCEFASLLLSGILCRGLSMKPISATALTIMAVAWIAYRNRLALANDALADGLFMFAHISELFSAFAFLFRALLLGAGRASIAVRFAFIMMPLQQALSAYYFVHAFSAVPELVASGHPFEMLQICSVAQLGAFTSALVLHLAEQLEMSPEEMEDSEDQADSTVSSMLHHIRAAWSESASDMGMPRAAAVRAAF